MSAKLKVSVIVPAYNAAGSIGQCLESLLSQSYPKDLYDVIVVDDGSTDETGVIVRQYPVVYLHQTNQGPAKARNKGAEKAQGEIVLFTDSDCIATPDWIEEMVAPFADPEVIAVKGAYLTKQSSLVARFAQLEFDERFEMLKKVESIDMVDTYSAGIRKEIFDRLHGFDTSFPTANNEDTELSYRMVALQKKMVFNPRAIVYHLGHPATFKRYATLKYSRGYWRMVVYKKFPEKMVKDTYTPQVLKLQIAFLFLLILSFPFCFVFPGIGGLFTLLFSIILCALMVPFTIRGIVKDPAAGLISPLLLLIRAAALGLGAVVGAIHSKTD